MYIHPHICIVYIQSLCIGLCIGLVLTETCLAQWLTLYKPAFFIQGEWFISWHYGTYTNMQMETWCEVEYSIPENKVPVHWTYIYHNRNLLKRSPSLKPSSTYFCRSTCSHVKKKAPKKQCCARGRTNKDRHNLLLLHNQAHDKKALENHFMLTYLGLDCVWGGHILRKISQLSKVCLTSPLMSHLSSSPMGVFPTNYVTCKSLLVCSLSCYNTIQCNFYKGYSHVSNFVN